MTGSMSNIVVILMRFARQGVCVMRYCGPMRHAVQFPAHRLGGRMELCVIRGYALSEVCVKRGSTVNGQTIRQTRGGSEEDIKYLRRSLYRR